MKNRRGDVPITILVIGVVMVCALALISFFSSSFKLEQSFTGVSVIDDFKVKIDEYNFYKSKNISEVKIDVALDIKENARGRYFQIERNKILVRYNLP